jgi:RNA polymerase primary sigma factor
MKQGRGAGPVVSVTSDDSEDMEEITAEELSSEEQLLSTGRDKGYVTHDDILAALPDAEANLEQREAIFAALADAGIPVVASADDIADPAGDIDEDDEDTDLTREIILEAVEIDDMVGLYMKEIGHVPLLTASQEVDLAQRMERGQAARESLLSGERVPEGRGQLERLIEDGLSAREHLINANSRLVISVARKYVERGVPFLDLIQEGNLGLMRATRKFDWRRGNKFSTYATWWIRQAVSRAVADQSRTIRVPVHIVELIGRLLRASHHLTQELGREPTVAELAEALDVTVRRTEQIIQAARPPISLETPLGDDESDNVLGDSIADDHSPALAELVTSQLLRERLSDVLSTLPAREVIVLKFRYGLVDGETHTLEAVGRKMGITRERVRQIEAQALSRLRDPAHARKLRDFLGE